MLILNIKRQEYPVAIAAGMNASSVSELVILHSALYRVYLNAEAKKGYSMIEIPS